MSTGASEKHPAAREELIAAMQPLAEAVSRWVGEDPARARAALEDAWPLSGEGVRAVERLGRAGLQAGWLTPREAGGVRFGRLSKDLCGSSVDAVVMAGPGPRHRHPRGEFNLLLPLEGNPLFDGRPPGWVVYGPGSEHVPTVRGGTMLIFYFLPGGEIEWC